LNYVRELWENEISPGVPESAQVQRMKKFMNFIGEGLAPAEQFLHEIRRTTTQTGFFDICARYFDHDEPMALEPAESAAGLIPSPTS
jgi:tRNA-dihydrouridine synthase B